MTLEYKLIENKNLESTLEFIYHTYLTTIKDEDDKEGQFAFYNDYINNDKLKEEFINNDKFFIGCYDVIRLVGVISISKTGFIDFLFVNRCYQGLHIGTRLLNKVIDYAKNNNICKLTLDSSISNQNFYLNFGFTKISEEVKVNNVRIIPMEYIIKS